MKIALYYWYYWEYDSRMTYAKVAISISSELLKQVDRLVKGRFFESRSQAFQQAIGEKLLKINKTRLAAECSKLNKTEEQKVADEGLEEDLREWPKY